MKAQRAYTDRPTKEQIAAMPPYAGLSADQLLVVEDSASLIKASKALQGITRVGFDTESKPTFEKGQSSAGPHLLQFATADLGILFPVEFTEGLQLALSILSNPEIEKVGFGLKGDRQSLSRRFGIKAHNLVDLSEPTKAMLNLKDLAGIRISAAMLFGARVSKKTARSNWAQRPLTKAQLRYAANDAYISLCVSDCLRNSAPS